jgi:hypothetical protein
VSKTLPLLKPWSNQLTRPKILTSQHAWASSTPLLLRILWILIVQLEVHPWNGVVPLGSLPMSWKQRLARNRKRCWGYLISSMLVLWPLLLCNCLGNRWGEFHLQKVILCAKADLWNCSQQEAIATNGEHVISRTPPRCSARWRRILGAHLCPMLVYVYALGISFTVCVCPH